MAGGEAFGKGFGEGGGSCVGGTVVENAAGGGSGEGWGLGWGCGGVSWEGVGVAGWDGGELSFVCGEGGFEGSDKRRIGALGEENDKTHEGRKEEEEKGGEGAGWWRVMIWARCESHGLVGVLVTEVWYAERKVVRACGWGERYYIL